MICDSDAAKMSHLNCVWCEEKVSSEVSRKYDACDLR